LAAPWLALHDAPSRRAGFGLALPMACRRACCTLWAVATARAPSPSDDDGVRRLDEPLLRSLHALLTEASVSQAAARLGVAQSALSRHLRVLRELTGDALLVRVGNRMVPTERAQMLAAPTRRILSDMSLITSQAQPLSPSMLRLSLRIAAYDFLPKQFFADLAERIGRQAPECELVIRGLGKRFATTSSLPMAMWTWSSRSGPSCRPTCARPAC